MYHKAMINSALNARYKVFNNLIEVDDKNISLKGFDQRIKFDKVKLSKINDLLEKYEKED